MRHDSRFSRDRNSNFRENRLGGPNVKGTHGRERWTEDLMTGSYPWLAAASLEFEVLGVGGMVHAN